jgi:hypothetical protein
MTLREEISKEVRYIIGGGLPEKFYCSKCGLLIVDQETSGMVEEKFGGYCDICECEEPEPGTNNGKTSKKS